MVGQHEQPRMSSFGRPSCRPLMAAHQLAPWYLSGLRAAEEAKRLWVKIIGNKSIGAYDIVWPGVT